MLYKDLLSTYIANSHLTLSQIEDRMRKKGFSTNKAYISKLQNGKLPPAGEDITRALAEITGGDPEELIMAGYIEKAPEEVQKLLNGIQDTNAFLKEIFIMLISDNKEAADSLVKEQIIEGEDPQADIFDSSILIDLFDDFSMENKIHALNTLISYTQENNLDLKDVLTSRGIIKDPSKNIEKMPVGNRILLPVIGTVTAGPHGLAYQEPLGEEPVDKSSINGGKYYWLKVKGDSMVGDGILPGDLALVREQPEVEYGELAVVIVDGEEGTLKRVFKKDGSIILQSSNPKYPPRIFTGTECETVRIVGKVKETKRKY